VTAAVLAAAVGAGVLVRELQPTASADGAASTVNNAPPRAPAPGPATVALVEYARDTGEATWRDQYRSTLDGSIVLHRLEPRAGGGLVALLSFTSLQDPADAPPELPVRCLRWWVSYPLIGEADELRLSPNSPGASLRVPC
jgi:hypothetical protein